jgi:hypothetical protein
MQIIDDLLPTALADEIETKFKQDTKWSLVDYSSGPEADYFDHPQIVDGPQFVNMSFHMRLEKDQIDKDTQLLLMNVLWLLAKRFDFELEFLLRIKNNCTLKDSTYIEKYHPPHVDADDPAMYTCAYYVNDSDGPLRMFDEEGNVTHTIEPKKGRCVVFKSNTKHAGTPPVNTPYRIMSNIIFKPNKDFL